MRDAVFLYRRPSTYLWKGAIHVIEGWLTEALAIITVTGRPKLLRNFFIRYRGYKYGRGSHSETWLAAIGDQFLIPLVELWPGRDIEIRLCLYDKQIWEELTTPKFFQLHYFDETSKSKVLLRTS